MQTLRADELAHILERVVEIGLRGGWKDVDMSLPCPVRGDSVSTETSRANLSPTSEVGILGSLPDLSEKFKVKDTDRSVENLDRKEVTEGKRT